MTSMRHTKPKLVEYYWSNKNTPTVQIGKMTPNFFSFINKTENQIKLFWFLNIIGRILTCHVYKMEEFKEFFQINKTEIKSNYLDFFFFKENFNFLVSVPPPFKGRKLLPSNFHNCNSFPCNPRISHLESLPRLWFFFSRLDILLLCADHFVSEV